MITSQIRFDIRKIANATWEICSLWMPKSGTTGEIILRQDHSKANYYSGCQAHGTYNIVGPAESLKKDFLYETDKNYTRVTKSSS